MNNKFMFLQLLSTLKNKLENETIDNEQVKSFIVVKKIGIISFKLNDNDFNFKYPIDTAIQLFENIIIKEIIKAKKIKDKIVIINNLLIEFDFIENSINLICLYNGKNEFNYSI